MDFINNNIKRLNSFVGEYSELTPRIPNIKRTELEHLRDSLFNSIITRNQNLEGNQAGDRHQSFEEMLEQMRGQDTTNISDLTKEFRKQIKNNNAL